MSDLCQFCGDDHAATHEINTVPARYEDDWTEEWVPACEDVADGYPSNVTRPITHYACSICRREIEREHPEPPLCRWCEGTTRAGGKQAANAERFPDPEVNHA